MGSAAVTPFELALAALLLVVNGAISLALGLGPRFTGRLAIAAVRMAVQVAAVGLVLSFVLARASPAWTALAALLMVLAAGQELFWQERPRGRLRWLAPGLGNVTLLLVGTLAAMYAALLVAAPPWHAPHHFLPILGMVLGTTLTSVAVALQSLTEGARRERSAIEARIAQGAGRFTAFAGVVRSAVATATTPLIATMAVAGVATFPGLMAGQILAGVDPAEAARLQIALLLVVSGAAWLGALAAAFGSVLLLTDRRHRLRLDRTV
jgi:putative ABC transport system permease protein